MCIFTPHSYLLTYSMEQSPSWAANRFAASQEIPRISRNPKVHYRTHKRPPPVSILGQLNPVHIPTSWRSIPILSTHLRLRLPSGLLPSGFPTKTLYTPLSSPIRPTCPVHLILHSTILFYGTVLRHRWKCVFNALPNERGNFGAQSRVAHHSARQYWTCIEKLNFIRVLGAATLCRRELDFHP